MGAFFLLIFFPSHLSLALDGFGDNLDAMEHSDSKSEAIESKSSESEEVKKKTVKLPHASSERLFGKRKFTIFAKDVLVNFQF